MGRAGRLIALSASGLLALAGPAFAGSYDVVSCGAAPAGANNAWTASTNAPANLAAGSACPPADAYSGLYGYDTLGSPSPGAGSRMEWTFTAPAGTLITRWRYDRYLGKYEDEAWSVYGRSGDGTVFDTCDFALPQDQCSVGAPGPGQGGFRDVQGLATNELVFGFRCDTAPGFTCATGATIHQVWAALYSSTVTLEEGSLPAVGAPVGDLVAGGWRRGSQAVSFTASDGVGIRETGVYVDGQALAGSTVTRTCDYTFPVPCTNPVGAVDHVVDTTQLADGERLLEVAAVDAAGNVRRGAPVSVDIDNNAPALGMTGPVGASSGPSVGVSWSGSDAGGSGIAGYDVEVSVDGGEFQPWLAGTTSTSATYAGTPGRRYRFRARASDVSGLLSGWAVSGEVAVNEPRPGGTPTAGSSESGPPPDRTGAQAPAGGAGSAPPGEGIGAPAATPRIPRLRVRAGWRGDRRLSVAGAISRAATGSVVATYAVRAGGRPRRASERLPVRSGRFRGSLSLPRPMRGARGGLLTIRYPGDAAHRPRSIRLRLRP